MFTLANIADIRRLRRGGWRMSSICNLFHFHTREQLVEAMDATLRYQTDHAARDHVNFVLSCQRAGVPMINGKEAWTVTADHGRVSYSPGFQ